MDGALVPKQPIAADYSSARPNFFVPFQYGSKYTKKARFVIFAAGICSLIFSLVMVSVGAIYLLGPVDGKKLLGVDQFMRVSRGLLILGTVLIGISVVQIISSVRPPFAPRKRIRMDLSLIICSLICSLLFFANSVSFFVLVSSVDSSIERAIDEQVVTAYGFDGEVTNVIDNLQVEHACCGGSNYEVYEDSRWATHPSDIVPKVGLVPDSCCVRNASTLEIVDAEACHGDTLTLPNSVYLNGCAPFLAAEERYHPLVFAFCSMLLCIWMALVSSCVFYVYKTHPRTTVI